MESRIELRVAFDDDLEGISRIGVGLADGVAELLVALVEMQTGGGESAIGHLANLNTRYKQQMASLLTLEFQVFDDDMPVLAA
jgi:hypothetical protein